MPLNLKVLGLAGFGLFVGYVVIDMERDVREVARQHGLTAEETAAYRACDRDMGKKKMTLKGAGTSVTSFVPPEVCACQSKAMARTFRPGAYGSHRRVVDVLTEGRSPSERLEATDLRSPSPAPELQFLELVGSLSGCITAYRQDNDRRVAEAVAQHQREREARARGPRERAASVPGELR